jgi:pyruvate kinase
MRRIAVAAVLLVAASAAYADREVTHHFESAAAGARVKRVVVDIPAGEIRVINSADSAIRVSGQARREFSHGSRDEEQKIVNAISAAVEISGDEATIVRRLAPDARGWSVRHLTPIDATIEVPRGVSVELATKYGEIHIDGTFGDIDVDLHAGEIHVNVPRRDVHDLDASVRVGEVHADYGDSRVSNEGVFPGTARWTNPNGGRSRISLHTTAGEIHVRLTQ